MEISDEATISDRTTHLPAPFQFTLDTLTKVWAAMVGWTLQSKTAPDYGRRFSGLFGLGTYNSQPTRPRRRL
jgi:hypothetical protein